MERLYVSPPEKVSDLGNMSHYIRPYEKSQGNKGATTNLLFHSSRTEGLRVSSGNRTGIDSDQKVGVEERHSTGNKKVT